MDDFPGILARDFGFKPQGKSAPMAPPRNNNNSSSGSFSSVNFGLGSGGSVNSRSFSASTKSAPIFDDHDHGGDSDGLLFNDVFGGPPKYSESRGGGGVTASSSSAFDYDSIFKDQNAKSASLPVFDKPVYDDDIFDGLPGLKSSSSGARSTKFDDVFTTIGTPASPKHKAHNNSSPFDNLLGNLGKKEAQSKRETAKVEKDSAVFDDLLPGFGRSSSPSITRSTSESSWAQKPSTNSAKTASSVMDDPFVVLESTSTPAPSSAGLFTDPLEEISKFSSSRSTKVDSSSVNRGAFDDIDAFDNLGKSVPPVSAGINKRGKNMSPLRTGSSIGGTYSPSNKEPVDKYAVDEAEGHSQKMPNDDFQESHETLFDMPTASSEFHRSTGQNVSSPSYVNASPSEANSPPRSEDISESSDDIWLTVSEVPLYTQPTSASPPSRPPPPRPPRTSKLETGSFSSSNSRKNFNEYSFSNSNSSSQSPGSNRAVRSSVPSQIDELEDFAMGRTQNNTNEHVDVLYREDVDVNASSAAAYAAAMKEAMDKAEAKFRQMREKEYLKATRSREAGQPDRDILEAQQRELRERQERLDCERQQRGREEEERELKRLEKERERAREIEREREENEREQRRLERERERAREIEREREKARQAVERATREARERAAAEARTKAERAAVGKATAEARERAGRAAAQRVQAEARERAAAEARERAENAAAEARERANAEAREREVQERAAVSRAEADARQRAERAAVERAAAEARERASAEARERAAAAARANQQRNENDLESFFSSRPSSAPRPRANSSDPFFDTQNKGGSETARRTSVGTTSNMKKASSTTNIVDDLSSIFGATGASGEFQEVEGETEERRRARLERHQRTQERAAKALAEKNQRDLQAQREQAERHRIAETLDVEIKRWAAGKEGNLRALLSTLQYVLWPECGWQPVSLTDLITAAAVKKVYRKATLCIHPDKVQQKGANLQQKYIAEKVFDLLKEAWNKFNSEELF